MALLNLVRLWYVVASLSSHRGVHVLIMGGTKRERARVQLNPWHGAWKIALVCSYLFNFYWGAHHAWVET